MIFKAYKMLQPKLVCGLSVAALLAILIVVMAGLDLSVATAQQQVTAQAKFAARIDQVQAAQAGIDYIHTDGSSGERYIVESVVGSLAVFDYDGDGWTDIYFINGAPLPGSAISPPPKNRLYRNLGNWTFVDVTDQAGVGDMGYGMGVVVGDYDQDGDPDLFISNFGTNVLYANNGDGTFTDVTLSSGVRGPHRFGAGNSFFDMDRDGDLDLYCASYVEFQYSDHKVRTIAGKAFHTGPNDYPPAADILFRNEGDGTFTDVSLAAGIATFKAPGMGTLAADFNDDGQVDVFVANDQQANYLWINDGAGNFQEQALLAGLAYDRAGRANANMGNDFADIDGDGLFDLVTTSYQEEMPVYYRGLGMGMFQDETNLARLDPSLTAHVTWGIGAVDFDNDRDRDLFIACGHFLDNIRFIDDRTDVKVQDYLLANNGAGKFSNATKWGGSFFDIVESSRGAAFDDLDNDGDVDIVVVNVNAAPSLGRTVVTAPHRGLAIRLIGTVSNRDAVGSQLTVDDHAGQTQKLVVLAGQGYESYYGQRLYVGLGTQVADQPIEILVTWPSGAKEAFTYAWPTSGGSLYALATLVEGTGRPVE